MRLGTLIKQLELCDPDATVVFNFGNIGPTTLESWRGVYAELALGYEFGHKTVAELLEECRSAVGKTFQGYKGGDFVMSVGTEVWVDNPGEYTQTQLLSVIDGKFEVVLFTTKATELR